MTADVAAGITKEEIAVYDRQIRLWGLEAQNLLRASRVLILGLSGLGGEVTKNLMLSGVGGLTIADDKIVQEDDLMSNFLLESDAKINRATASSAKAKVLNPMVQFQAVEKGIKDFTEEELKQFHLIILIDEPYETVSKMDAFCRQNNIKKQNKPELIDEESVGPVADTVEEEVFEKEVFSYPSFDDAFNVDWLAKKYLRKAKRLVPPSYVYIRSILRAQQQNISLDSDKMAKLFNDERGNVNQTDLIPEWNQSDVTFTTGPHLSPVAAIVGGMMGQEAVKALSEARHPLSNIFIYSAPHTTGHIVRYPPE